jgi:hypothetical protein
MGISELKRELRKLDKDQLIDLISDLYKKEKSVKQLLDFYVNPNEKELFKEYRHTVITAFYPEHGYEIKLHKGREAISDFGKYGPSTHLLADLMLVYVETGISFTNDFGDMNESFYSSLESMYVRALKLIQKEGILNKFAIRAKAIVDDTRNVGWGFHDYLAEVYYSFFPDEIND